MPFQVVRNDITRMQVDAIVNTANPKPIIGRGTDYAIYEAAGAEEMLEKRREIGELSRGQAAITPGFRLPAKYVIHTVGPKWIDGRQGEDVVLRACYVNSLKLAHQNQCKSIAFPLISTGVYNFPKELALQIVNAVVSEFLDQIEDDMMIYLVVFDRKATRLSERFFAELEQYIDDRYVDLQHQTQACSVDRRYDDRQLRYDDRSLSVPPENLRQNMPYASEAPTSQPSYAQAPLPMPNASQSPSKARQRKEKRSIFSGLQRTGKKKRNLEEILEHTEETFQQMLLRLIEEKGMTNPQVYKKANQTKKLFSKIKADIYYQPKKNTALAFAIALELSLDETKDLLIRAGYALSPSSKSDIIISYFIENAVYDIYAIEEALFAHDLPTLCNY